MKVRYFVLFFLCIPVLANAAPDSQTFKQPEAVAAQPDVKASALSGAEAQAQLNEALKMDEEYKRLDKELEAAVKKDSANESTIKAIFNKKEQRAREVAKNRNLDWNKLQEDSLRNMGRGNPSSQGAKVAGKKAAEGESLGSGGGATGQEPLVLKFTSFPQNSSASTCGGKLESRSDNNKAHVLIWAPETACGAEQWQYVNVLIDSSRAERDVTAVVAIIPDTYASAFSENYVYSDALVSLRFGGTAVRQGTVDCLLIGAQAHGKVQTDMNKFSYDSWQCELGKLQAGTLQIGLYARGDVGSVPPGNASNGYGAGAAFSSNLLTLSFKPAQGNEKASSSALKENVGLGDSRPPEALNNRREIPDCPAPVIVSPKEGEVINKAPLLLTVKQGGSGTSSSLGGSGLAPAGSGPTATISIDRVGGGNAALFPMKLDSTKDLSGTFGDTGDTFPESAHATYKITAQVDSKLPGNNCKKSAPRTFRIAGPYKPPLGTGQLQRNKSATGHQPPDLIHEENRNPTSPPPVERRRSQ